MSIKQAFELIEEHLPKEFRNIKESFYEEQDDYESLKYVIKKVKNIHSMKFIVERRLKIKTEPSVKSWYIEKHEFMKNIPDDEAGCLWFSCIYQNKTCTVFLINLKTKKYIKNTHPLNSIEQE